MQNIKIKFTLVIGFLICILCTSESLAQSTRSVEEVLQQRSVKQSTQKKKKFTLFKKKQSPYKNDAILRAEFEQRMKSNKKKNKKEARLALKPQYSDPSYFGHKKLPKKRPPGKKKFCKECHIVH